VNAQPLQQSQPAASLSRETRKPVPSYNPADAGHRTKRRLGKDYEASRLRCYPLTVFGARVECRPLALIADADHEDLAAVDTEGAEAIGYDASIVRQRRGSRAQRACRRGGECPP